MYVKRIVAVAVKTLLLRYNDSVEKFYFILGRMRPKIEWGRGKEIQVPEFLDLQYPNTK
jgi:hypothetical protein